MAHNNRILLLKTLLQRTEVRSAERGIGRRKKIKVYIMSQKEIADWYDMHELYLEQRHTDKRSVR